MTFTSFSTIWVKEFLILWIFGLMFTMTGFSQAAKVDRLKMSKPPISLELKILSPNITTKSEAILNAKITNLGSKPFRIWEGINIAQPEQVWGEIALEILLDGKPYLDWQDLGVNTNYEWPDKDDVQILEFEQALVCEKDLRTRYPLLKPGHYQIRGIFRPVRIRGLKLSMTKPVFSDWIEVEVR